MRNDLFLFLLILAFRLADGVTSYLPASGYLPGLTEGNPVALFAIQKWGFYQAFAIMLGVSIGFTGAFVAATYLEELRSTGRVNYARVKRIRQLRSVGLVFIALISAMPLFNNLMVAAGL